jgi:hypothetical protein
MRETQTSRGLQYTGAKFGEIVREATKETRRPRAVASDIKSIPPSDENEIQLLLPSFYSYYYTNLDLPNTDLRSPPKKKKKYFVVGGWLAGFCSGAK